MATSSSLRTPSFYPNAAYCMRWVVDVLCDQVRLANYVSLANLSNYTVTALQKQIGCFNHRMVTLVAVKLWL